MEDDFPMRNSTTNETSDPYPRDEQLAQVEIGTLICIFMISVIGNGLVLLALYAKKWKGGRKILPRMYFFIFHLCVADLINAFFNILPQLLWDITYRFKGEQILCKAVKYGQILGPYLSSYILTVTAIDRYRAICYPLTYYSWSSKRCRIFIAYAWCISMVFSIPQTYVFSYQEIAPGIWDCWATFPESWGERTYVVWYSFSIFIIPLAVLIFTYTFICRVIWRNAPTDLGKQGHLISRAKINTIKQTIAVIAAYIICSLPFIVAELWAVWDPRAYDAAWSGPLFTILVLMSSLNSCANPWIFMIFNSDLFEALKYFLTKKTLSSNIFTKNCSSDCSYQQSTIKRKSSKLGCTHLKKMFSTEEIQDVNHFDLKRQGTSGDENGTTITTEITN